MKTDRTLSTLLLAIALSLSTMTTPALANELWVTTEGNGKGAGKKVGNWTVSDDGDTRFTFAVPDNMKAFVAAKVVVIGKKDKDINYDLSLSISKNGLRQDDFTDDTFQELPAFVFKDELLEIDVSAPFLGLEFFPGQDYVALHFKADKKKDVRVLGLRFQYDAGVFLDESTGKIGIGTTDPQSELEVEGTVAVSAFASTSPLIFEAPAGTERMRIADSDPNEGTVFVGGNPVIEDLQVIQDLPDLPDLPDL